MSNPFKYSPGIPYVQMPRAVFSEGMRANWGFPEKSLFGALYAYAHRHSVVEMTLTGNEVRKLTGISSLNSVKDARDELVAWGVIQAIPAGAAGFTYGLLNPETGVRLTPRPKRRRKTTNGETFVLDVNTLTREQRQRYFEARLPNQDLGGSGGDWVPALCPFHPDSRPSLSINLEHGGWRCHDCTIRGGIIGFEKKISKCNTDTALRNIAKLAGVSVSSSPRITKDTPPEAVYPYCDEDGVLLYEVLRFPGKDFRVRRPIGKNRYAWNLKGVRKVLYNLPLIRAASVLVITEGEKDSDRLNSLGLIAADGSRVVATTSPFGAGNWEDCYSAFFKDKLVIITPDLDQPGDDAAYGGKGLAHAEDVRDRLRPYAREVRLVEFRYSDFSDPTKNNDVSDFLNTHTPAELVEKMGFDWFSADEGYAPYAKSA